MLRHYATYRLRRTYTHREDLDGRAPEEALVAAQSFPAPAPWDKGWELISVANAEPADQFDDAITVRREMVWEITLPIWESDAKKARQMADEEAEMLRCENRERTPDWMAVGWNGRDTQIEICSFVRETSGPRLRHNISIPWRTLVSVDQSWWPHDHQMDEAFEVFRHVATTAVGYERQERWHKPKTLDLLSRTEGRIPLFTGCRYSLMPITSVGDLRRRFQAALLGTAYDFYDRWRQDHGINLDGAVDIRVAHRGRDWHAAAAEAGIAQNRSMTDILRDLLETSRGLLLAPQLNSVHSGARRIEGIGIHVGKFGFSVLLSYGYKGSAWIEEIACSRGGEPFIDTLLRAWKLFRTDLVPDFEEQVSARYRKLEKARRELEDA